MTLVSVVTPMYQCEHFIEEALLSVYAQTHRPIEHVVVDDCSPDDSAGVALRLADRLNTHDYLIRLVSHQTNQGAAAALLTGIQSAEGAAVCWLSADDAFAQREKTAAQLSLLEDADVVFDSRWLEGPTQQEAKVVRGHWPRFMGFHPSLRSYDSRATLLGLMFANPINGSTVMLRRASLDVCTFDRVLGNLSADGDLWMRFAALGIRFQQRVAHSVFYRRHPQQTSGNVAAMTAGAAVARLRILDLLSEVGLLRPLLDEHSPLLLAAVSSGVHRWAPYSSHFLARACSRSGRPDVRMLGRLMLTDLERNCAVGQQAERLLMRARELKHSDEFERFRAGVERGDALGLRSSRGLQ